jgi:hypothetical protein
LEVCAASTIFIICDNLQETNSSVIISLLFIKLYIHKQRNHHSQRRNKKIVTSRRKKRKRERKREIEIKRERKEEIKRKIFKERKQTTYIVSEPTFSA